MVPSGFSLRGLDMLLDMRLKAVSSETAGSDRSETLALGLSEPLAWNGAAVEHSQVCQYKTLTKEDTKKIK